MFAYSILARKILITMGLITSFFRLGSNTGKTDDPDPNTGLTSRERYQIQSTWRNVMADPTGNGMKLFLRYDI